MTKTLHTSLGKIRTGSTRRFIAVARLESTGQLKVIARSDSRETLETRLRREGWMRELDAGEGRWIIHMLRTREVHRRAEIVDSAR